MCEWIRAFGVFMNGDVEAARRLIREKTELRSIDLVATQLGGGSKEMAAAFCPACCATIFSSCR